MDPLQTPSTDPMPTLFIGAPKQEYDEVMVEWDFAACKKALGEQMLDGYVCDTPTAARQCLQEFIKSINAISRPVDGPEKVRIIFSAQGRPDHVQIKNLRIQQFVSFSDWEDDVICFARGGELARDELLRLMQTARNSSIHFEIVVCARSSHKWNRPMLEFAKRHTQSVAFHYDTLPGEQAHVDEHGSSALRRWQFYCAAVPSGGGDENQVLYNGIDISSTSPSLYSRGYAPVHYGSKKITRRNIDQAHTRLFETEATSPGATRRVGTEPGAVWQPQSDAPTNSPTPWRRRRRTPVSETAPAVEQNGKEPDLTHLTGGMAPMEPVHRPGLYKGVMIAGQGSPRGVSFADI